VQANKKSEIIDMSTLCFIVSFYVFDFEGTRNNDNAHAVYLKFSGTFKEE
jgi:hypothetical protein